MYNTLQWTYKLYMATIYNVVYIASEGKTLIINDLRDNATI